WQLAHASVIELPSRSIFTFWDPCGLWQVVHSILPSRTGICAARWTLLICGRWHCAHVSEMVSVLSSTFSDFGACTLWQVVQVTLRALCLLPDHSLCSVRAWQVVHSSLTSRADMAPGRPILLASPSASTCAWPGPWQLSHPRVAAGDRGFRL